MDEANRRELIELATDDEVRAKIRLLREWDDQAMGHDRAVPDPYYGGEREFAEMFDIIERSTSALADELGQQVEEGR